MYDHEHFSAGVSSSWGVRVPQKEPLIEFVIGEQFSLDCLGKKRTTKQVNQESASLIMALLKQKPVKPEKPNPERPKDTKQSQQGRGNGNHRNETSDEHFVNMLSQWGMNKESLDVFLNPVNHFVCVVNYFLLT